MQIVASPDRTDLEDTPTIFLAGPIQGALDWQTEACEIIGYAVAEKKIVIANPRRHVFPQDSFEEQVDWETLWLRRAGADGVILFWLANEHEHDCSRSYAQTTRFELAEWVSVARHNHHIQLAIGIDDSFSGSRYIRRRLSQDIKIPVFDTLRETCEQAVKLLDTEWCKCCDGIGLHDPEFSSYDPCARCKETGRSPRWHPEVICR